MATNPLKIDSSKVAVIDANVCIAFVSKEVQTGHVAEEVIDDYSNEGFLFFAPNVFVSETLYALCKKLHAGEIDAIEHAQAIDWFQTFLEHVLFPKSEAHLVKRANEIQAGYGCSRNADSLYIALAEELMNDYDVVELVTFDKELPNQAARHAPTVIVRLLEI